VIQANLAAIGVQVDVGTAEWGSFYPSLLKPDWDMDLNRWTWSDPSVMSQLFRSPGHRQLLPSTPAIDSALDSADGELDFKKRMQFVSDAQEAILKDRLILPILTDWPMTVTRKSGGRLSSRLSRLRIRGRPETFGLSRLWPVI
jgi:peptide/nickel transport system substrate-binding protein